jgi:hypothetical protein
MRLVGVLLCPLLLSSAPATSAALELLQNGGFEQGTSGWSGLGLSSGDCDPHDGGEALQIASNGSAAFAQQNVGGPLGDGAYALSGWLLVASGAPEIELILTWLDGDGNEIGRDTTSVSAGVTYDSFGVDSTRPAGAESLRVRIAIDAGDEASICVDDLSLDGPPPPPPTAVPTATTPSSPVPTFTPIPSATPKPTSTAKPTSTPKPASTSKPKATAKPNTSTSAASAPAFAFVNGGLEQGLEGWRKYGGELSVVGTPAYAGTAAGALTSGTESTKWAYQTVLLDAAPAYEFAGYVNATPGVSGAFLRISWYASDDGSGQALATTDSTATIGGGAGYTYLTTGPVVPPPGARSARPRVMLRPAGSATATIYFDEVSFAPAAAPPAEPQVASSTTDGDDEPELEAALAPSGATDTDEPGAGPADWDAEPGEEPIEEVRSAVADSTPADAAAPQALTRGPAADDGVPLVWLIAAVLFAAGLGGSYVYGRHGGG